MIYRLTLLTLFFSLPTLPAWAQSSATTLRLALAAKVVSLNSPRAQLLDPNNNLMRNDTMRQVVQELDFDRIEVDAARIMASQFTREELEALLNFYTSDVGLRIHQKMGPFQRMVSGLVEEAMQQKFKELVAAGKIQNLTPGPAVTPSVPGLR